MTATIIRKGELPPTPGFTPTRWLAVSEVRIMPRFFVLTAIVVTICAVATLVAAADRTSFLPALAGL